MRFRSLLRQVPNKREFLANSLRSLGVLQALEGFARLRARGLLVLTYHRIAEPGVQVDPYYDPVISATPATFRAQMEFISSRYRAIGLDELPRLQDHGANHGPKPPVLITFDDGYRDNFEAALPVLSRCGVPATFFVPTAALDVPRLPWWDHVAYVLKRTGVSSFSVPRWPEDPNPIAVSLGAPPLDGERTAAIMSIIARFLAREIHDDVWFLAQLDEQAQVDVDGSKLGRELFMGWDELKHLRRAGMSIGSHGHSHVDFSLLDADAQQAELIVSKRLLESNLDCEVTAIAYPYGWRGSFTARTVALAREAGYRWAFTSLEGINRLSRLQADPLELYRLNIGAGDSAVLLRARMDLHATVSRSFL